MNETKINKKYKKPLQVYFTPVEWDMLDELLEDTNAESLSAVLRAALISYYVDTMEKLEKEAKSDG